MENFSQGYKHYGLNRGSHEGKTGIWYREWAPGAKVRRMSPGRLGCGRRGCCLPGTRPEPEPLAPAPCAAAVPGAGGRVQQLGPQAGALGDEELLWRLGALPA
jgi:hypothetical protein